MKLAIRRGSLAAAAAVLFAGAAPSTAASFVAPSVRLAFGLSMWAAPPVVAGPAPCWPS